MTCSIQRTDFFTITRLKWHFFSSTVSGSSEIEEFIKVDNDVAMCAPITEEDIVSEVNDNQCITSKEDKTKKNIKHQQFMKLLVLLKLYKNKLFLIMNLILFKKVKFGKQCKVLMRFISAINKQNDRFKINKRLYCT